VDNSLKALKGTQSISCNQWPGLILSPSTNRLLSEGPLLLLCQLPLNAVSKLECGSMPNVMVALPNIGGAFCSTPQSMADARY